ncbi:hypothetical protein VTO42DRAFT_5829 [Malbranchea cinnamomea]
MSKKFKSQASSSRAASGAFGSGTFGGFFSASPQPEGASSSLSYISEPPDLSRISDPQVVVSFKNLLKKDSTTKMKALEDLHGFLSAWEANGSSLEDGLLEAWAHLYPRTSIDSARRVRQLAHTIQGSIVSITGKRVARHVPKVVGAWLAGLYDNDKPVQRAAQESIVKAFPTEEKRRGIWKVYQSQILEFVVDAVLRQTPQTLSDERTVKPDEANAKHARVVATGLQVLIRLLSITNIQELPGEPVETLLGSRNLWKLAYHDDPFVRRALYELLGRALTVAEGYIDWRVISACLLSKALSMNQRGSASEFSNLLLNITKMRPQLWTEDYSGKTAAAKRLLQYMKKGSEGASHMYWINLHLLLKEIPREIFIQQNQDEKESFASFLTAFHEGLLNREEPRANITSAWSAYLKTVTWMSSLSTNREERLALLQDHFCPVVTQIVLADPEKSQWTISDPQAPIICSRSLFTILSSGNGDDEFFQRLWSGLTELLIGRLKLSSPQQSQEYRASQDAICAQAARFFEVQFDLIGQVTASGTLKGILSIIHETTIALLQASLDVLRSRNGKPYGAAAMLDEAAARAPEIVNKMNGLGDILTQDIPNLIFSPSADRLISLLFRCRGQKEFDIGFDRCIKALFDADQQRMSALGLRKVFSSVTSRDIESSEKVKSLITNCLDRALQGDREAWTDIVVLLKNSALNDQVALDLFRRVVDELSLVGRAVDALHGLNYIVSECKESLQIFVTGPDGPKFISKLLYLAESPVDEVSRLADTLETSIKDLINREDNSSSTIKIIQQSFESIGEESLSLDSLISISEELLLRTPSEARPSVLSQLLPTSEQWEKSLKSFLCIPPKRSSSLISPLAGTVYLVKTPTPESTSSTLGSAPRDATHFSLAYRLAFYVTKLLSFSSIDHATEKLRSTLFYYLPLAIQLIDDDLNIEHSTGVMSFVTPEVRDECAELISEARLIMKNWLHEYPSFVDIWEQRLYKLTDDTPETYRVAEALVRTVSEKDALGKLSSAEASLQFAEQASGPGNPFLLPTVLAAYRNSIAGIPSSTKLCNRLIADLTGLDSLPEVDGTRKMVALNLLIQGENSVIQKVPTQRLVFFVKHLVQCLQSNELSRELISETMKALTTVLPLIKEIYGSHWSDIFEVLASLWESSEATEEYTPVLHSSFRLFACLKGLATDESNDDLEDAWIAAQKTHPPTLIQLLTKFDQSYSLDLPLNITTDLLARQVSAVSLDHVDDVSDVFSALSVQNKGIQRAAYEALHRIIPKVQEKVSFDVALSKTVVNLPDELISLLVEAPAVRTISQILKHESSWIEIRCYLLSWKTVFDHFIHASIPVREQYTVNIKEHECLPPLLEFMFDFLQDQKEKLIDASKFSIRTFDLDQSDSAEKETQWLLVHLYYLCLKYLPNLTKAWWMDSKKRVKGPIEAWTEKYITPFIIEDSLNEVSEWSSAQDWSNEEQPLDVKVSQKAAEIVASIEIDEESPPTSIAISLPSTYPLQQAAVIGRYRVVVDEKKWKNWLLTIQGVIMFSNGNLVDGLLAFRRNVQAALKGHGECTICCSVISTNMQTPNKRCATCKHTFHSDCLFRWFRSSNSSSCPLCRNNFLYS